MHTRRRLYVAGLIAASLSYTIAATAFTGEFLVRRWLVFVAIFLVAYYAFELLLYKMDELESA